jgi:4'-phosphopantetheinyl transferase
VENRTTIMIQHDKGSGMTTLTPGQVIVWWMDVHALTDPLPAHWFKLLDQDEQTKASRFHFAADRRQYIAAHALVRSMLASYTGERPDTLQFWRAAGGRPELAQNTDLRFNLSRTRTLVACALARVDPVGLDIESFDHAEAGPEIAQSCFTQTEIELVRKLGHDGFLRLWTLKEAFLKATGDGLSRPLNSFSFSLDPIRIDNGGANGGWHFAQLCPLANHWLAVALHSRGAHAAQIELRQIASNEL